MVITFIMLFGVQQLENCEIQSAREVGDAKDGYAIFILRGSDVVVHFAQKISAINASNDWNIMPHI